MAAVTTRKSQQQSRLDRQIEREQENHHSLGIDHPKKPRRSSTKNNSNSNTDIYPDEEDNSIISKSNSGSDGNSDGNGNDNKYKTRN